MPNQQGVVSRNCDVRISGFGQRYDTILLFDFDRMEIFGWTLSKHFHFTHTQELYQPDSARNNTSGVTL